MPDVILENINKSFDDVQVLRDINLTITEGEFIVFVGPSGCGKSTLLRIIAGLEDITSGTLKFGEEVMNEVAASKRGLAMVFQNYALYPHKTVFENMAFALRMAKKSEEEIQEKVHETAAQLGLTDYLERSPKELSGGQRQRVAIGRTLVRDPKVFLFDEPLSNLDAKLRVAMRIEIANLNESLKKATMIYVTHDQVEAMTLADRIVVLSKNGGIEQVGTPLDLYQNPADLFVAGFIGSPAMNIIDAKIVQTGPTTVIQPQDNARQLTIPVKSESEFLDSDVKFGIRPEHLTPATDDLFLIEGTVSYIEELGDLSLVYIDVGDEKIVMKSIGLSNHKRGDFLRLTSNTSDIHLFDSNGVNFKRH